MPGSAQLSGKLGKEGAQADEEEQLVEILRRRAALSAIEIGFKGQPKVNSLAASATSPTRSIAPYSSRHAMAIRAPVLDVWCKSDISSGTGDISSHLCVIPRSAAAARFNCHAHRPARMWNCGNARALSHSVYRPPRSGTRTVGGGRFLAT